MRLEQWVGRLVGSLGRDAQVRFAAGPTDFMQADLGLQVRAVDSLADRRNDGGACDGISYLADGVVLYAPTPFNRRQNFTLAHELGHWLVDNDEELYDWLADQTDPPRVLETVCDHVAQQLLLPEDVFRSACPDRPIRSRHVLTLYEHSQASRPVCAIALAGKLPGAGAVVIIDGTTRVVAFASITPDPEDGWPTVFPWRGQCVPDGQPLLTADSTTGVTRRLSWRNPWDKQQDYYVDAVADDRRVIAVFSATDLWGCEQLHIEEPREFDVRPVLEIYCCGRSRNVRGYPCASCGEPYCSECGDCRCSRTARREQACHRCFVTHQPHLLVTGLCEDCR